MDPEYHRCNIFHDGSIVERAKSKRGVKEEKKKKEKEKDPYVNNIVKEYELFWGRSASKKFPAETENIIIPTYVSSKKGWTKGKHFFAIRWIKMHDDSSRRWVILLLFGECMVVVDVHDTHEE